MYTLNLQNVFLNVKLYLENKQLIILNSVTEKITHDS